MCVPHHRLRVFVFEIINQKVVMRLRLYLVAKGVEHYYLGPLGCPEMATTISNYKERFGSADIVFASPPCQDFSLVNPARESSSC